MIVQFYCYCFLHAKYIFLRLWDYATPGYRRNALCAIKRHWVIIKMLYRYLRMCLLGWHRSILGFVTLSIGEVSLALWVMHITISLASNVTNELVASWLIMERVKRLAGNKIELGIEIPTIESRASNITMTKGTCSDQTSNSLISVLSVIIPSSILLLASLFTRSVMQHPATNSLVTLLARLIVMCKHRGPRDTSPILRVTNPNLDLCQPNKHLQRHRRASL